MPAEHQGLLRDSVQPSAKESAAPGGHSFVRAATGAHGCGIENLTSAYCHCPLLLSGPHVHSCKPGAYLGVHMRARPFYMLGSSSVSLWWQEKV